MKPTAEKNTSSTHGSWRMPVAARSASYSACGLRRTHGSAPAAGSGGAGRRMENPTVVPPGSRTYSSAVP